MFTRFQGTALSCIAISSLLIGCETGGSQDIDDPTPPGDARVLSGDITQSEALSGPIVVTTDATIKSGVEITIAAGSSIEAQAGVFLRVEGTLNITGTAQSPVSITPLAGQNAFGGISVDAGGSLSMTHATGQDVAVLVNCASGALACDLDNVQFTSVGKVLQTSGPATLTNSEISDLQNGGITISAGANVTITDSSMHTSSHDLIVMSGGTLVFDHSRVGNTDPNATDHCGFHIGGADSLTITNSILDSSVVGMMIAGTNGAKINYNNIALNDTDIQKIGPNTAVDMQFNYWDEGAPDNLPAGEFNVGSPATSPYPDAGPRN